MAANTVRTRAPFTHADLARLVDPRTIAIVGMSPRPGAFGMRSFENLQHFGGVRLNIAGEGGLRLAYAEIVASVSKVTSDISGVLVQPMAQQGVEVIFGARVDPVAGAVVLVGLGGVMVELLRDTVVALAPVSVEEAQAMLARLKGYRLLTGFRGSAPVDLDALADALARFSELAADQADRVAEIDVNPIIARPVGVLVVDALISG